MIRLGLLFLATFILSVLYGLSFVINIVTDYIGGSAIDVGYFLVLSGIATVLVVVCAGRLSDYLSAWWLLFLGALSYSIGLLLLALCHHVGLAYFVAAIATGLGWGGFYVAAPMVVGAGLSDQRRVVVFNYLTACIAGGAGIGPILFQWLHHQVNVPLLFGAGAAIGCIDAILFLALYCFSKSEKHSPIMESRASQSLALRSAYRSIVLSRSLYPIILVFLGACVFTSMMYFQTVFAAAAGVSYSVFYLLFTGAMVSVRFTLSPIIAKKTPGRMVFSLSILLLISVSLFTYSSHGAVFYWLAALLFGASYGLLYPLIKAIAVNVADQKLHQHVIAVFTLSYFIGVYVFPWLMGHALAFWGQLAAMILMLVVAFLYVAVAGLAWRVNR